MDNRQCSAVPVFYFLSFLPDGTQLYLDGELFEEAGENTEVGGWWQGAERKMNNINQLRGFLAGLSVMVGRREEGGQRGVEVSGTVQRVTPAVVLIKLIYCVLLC